MTTRHQNNGLRKLCACPRRQWSKCRHSWHFAFNHKGARYRFSLERHLGRRRSRSGIGFGPERPVCGQRYPALAA